MGAVFQGMCYAADAYQFSTANLFPTAVMAASGAYLAWRWVDQSFVGIGVGLGLGVLANYVIMDRKKSSMCASPGTAALETPLLLAKGVWHVAEDEWGWVKSWF